MPRENRMDAITDRLRKRVDRLLGSAHKQFKGSNPYRQEPVSDEERIQRYLGWSGKPEEQQLRQQMGDAQIDQIHVNMHELINKKVRNARL